MTAPSETVIRAHRLLAGAGEPATPDAEVAISGGRITAVRASGSVELAPDVEVVEHRGTLLPGLIDAHMHFFGVPSTQIQRLPKESESYRMGRAVAEARRMLLAGITTARDLGSSIGPDIRRAIDEGLFPGPRLLAAGEFVTTTDGTWQYNSIPLEWARQRDMIADGPDEMRAIVRRRTRRGATAIKLGLSKGCVGDHLHAWGDDPGHQLAAMTTIEAAAAVDEAHGHELRVAGHAIGDAAVGIALDAGVDTIEHGYGITPAMRDRLAAAQTPVVSTISQLQRHVASFDEFAYPVVERDALRRHFDRMRVDFEANVAAGVRYILGSDLIGPPSHPQDIAAHEFAYAVEWGMTPAAAIRAGTSDSATALGLGADVGHIGVGKWADLVGVVGDPLEDITELQRPVLVLKGGDVIRGASGIREGRIDER